MQCGYLQKKKRAITLFFVIISWEITCLFRVNTNASHQRDDVRIYCVKLFEKRKITFCSISEGKPIYFLKTLLLFVADHFRFICIHSGVLY